MHVIKNLYVLITLFFSDFYEKYYYKKINKKGVEVDGEQLADVLNEQEIEEIMKIILKRHPSGVFPYYQIYDIMLEYKIENLKNGLMEVIN